MSDTSSQKVTISVIGAGGCGINFARNFLPSRKVTTLFFDTSKANLRDGESVNIVTNGSGSGGDRAANARDIERNIPLLTDADLGKADIAIVIASTGGGSGSVLSPLLIREYARRGVRPIGVIIADTSSTVGAKNTQNTLKTFMAVAKNNSIYLPIILLSNDHVKTNKEVDIVGTNIISSLIDILTEEVLEIDRNDRLNWVDSSAVTGSPTGLKILSIYTSKFVQDPKIVLGIESEEMVDSLLIIQHPSDESGLNDLLPPSRLKKTGLFVETKLRMIGRVSSDISAINSVIDQVDRMNQVTKAQKHLTIDRLAVDDSDSDVFI